MFDSMLSQEQFCLLHYISSGFSVAASSFSIGIKLKNKISFFLYVFMIQSIDYTALYVYVS